MKKLYLILGLIGACTYQVTDVEQAEPNEASEDPMLSRGLMMKEGASGGWQVNGKLTPISPFNGSTIIPTLGQQGVSLQAVFKESKEHTIQLDIDNSADMNTSAHFVRAVATITWGVEGGFVTRRVSCLPGMSITGVAQAVKIVIQDASIITAPGQILQPYIVAAQVAPGSRGSVQQPPYLEGDNSALGVNTSIVVPAPISVGAISLYLTLAAAIGVPLTTGMFLVTMQGVNGLAIKTWDPIQQQGWIPISPGTVSLKLQSSAAAPPTFFTPIWGIDG